MFMTTRHIAPFSLPIALNHFKVAPDQFSGLKLAGSSAALYWLLNAYLVQSDEARPISKARAKAVLRRVNRRKPWARRLFTETARLLEIPAPSLEKKLRDFAEKLIDENRIVAQDGQASSLTLARFSYDPHNCESEVEMSSVLECPRCGHEEVVREQDREYALEMANDFDVVQGSAARCNRCDELVRPSHRPAQASDEVPLSDYEEDTFQEICDFVFDITKEALAGDLPDKFLVDAHNLDWRGRSGSAEVEFSSDGIASMIGVEGTEFCVWGGEVLRTDAGLEIRAVVAHHDVPTGGTRYLQPAWECDLGDNLITGDKLKDAEHLGKVATIVFDEKYRRVHPDSLEEQLEELEQELELTPEDDTDMVHAVEFLSCLFRALRDRLNNKPTLEDAERMRACIRALEEQSE